MKRRKQVLPVNDRTATNRNRKTRPTLRVNKVRHVFPRKTSVASAKDPTAGTSKSAVPRKQGKGRAVRGLKQKTADREKGIRRGKVDADAPSVESDSLEPVDSDEFSRNKKVYRALKKLHIDFNETKSFHGISSSGLPSDAPLTKPLSRRSTSKPEVSETVAASSSAQTSTAVRKPRKGVSGHGLGVALTSKRTRALADAVTKRAHRKIYQRHESSVLRRKLSRSKLLQQTESVKEVLSDVTEDSKTDSLAPVSTKRKSSTRLSKPPVKNSSEPMETEENTALNSSSQSKNTSTTMVATQGSSSDLDVSKSRGVLRSRSAHKGKEITKTVQRGRGRPRSFSPAASRGRGKANVHRGRGRLVQDMASKSDTCVNRERSAVETLLEGRTSRSLSNTLGRRGRPKKTQPVSECMEVEKSTDHTICSEGKTKAATNSNQSETGESTDSHSHAESVGEAADNLMECSEAGDVTKCMGSSPTLDKDVELSKQMKVRSTSLECLVQDRSLLVEKKETVGYSRCSSPGGTENRVKYSGVSLPTVDLTRSSSLDNLLCKTQSISDIKHVLPELFSREESTSGTVAAREKTVNSNKPKTEFTPFSMNKSAEALMLEGGHNAPKRKRMSVPDSVGESRDDVSESKKKRLLRRLQDSSTHQMPDILPSSRASRAAAVSGSPAVSRESSPGTFVSVKRKKQPETKLPEVEKTEADMDIDSHVQRGERICATKTEQLTSSDNSGGQLTSLKNSDNLPCRDHVLKEEDSFCKEDQKSPTTSTKELIHNATDGLPVMPSKMSTELETSPPVGLVAVKRGPGRPKGSGNRKPRLIHIKRHVSQSKGTHKVSKLTTGLQGKRGRPRKHNLLKNTEVSASSMTAISKVCDSDMLEEKKEICGDSVLPAISVTANIVQKKSYRLAQKAKLLENMQNESTERTCALDDKSLMEKTATNTATTSQGIVPESKVCGAEVTSDTLQQQSSIGASSSRAARLYKSRKASQVSGAERRNALPSLARMKRKRMRKSRWSIGKLPKQSLSALNSSVHLTKPQSVGVQQGESDELVTVSASASTTDSSHVDGTVSEATESKTSEETHIIMKASDTEPVADHSPQAVSEVTSSNEPAVDNQALSSGDALVSSDKSCVTEPQIMPDAVSSHSEKLQPETSDAEPKQTDRDEVLASCEQSDATSRTHLPSIDMSDIQVSSEVSHVEIPQKESDNDHSQDIPNPSNTIPSSSSSALIANNTANTSEPEIKKDQQRSVSIAKRKQVAISRELKRLQTDEGARKIMSWHEKRKLKSLGKLLRSRLKNEKKTPPHSFESDTEPKLKTKSGMHYSIDTISETRLVFKTGKTNNQNSAPEHTEDAQTVSSNLLSQEVPCGVEQDFVNKIKRGILSVSSSLDSEDGPPPNIIEVTPIKDNRSERCRSEELSPPPLIRPEDLFSEDYFASMPVTSSSAQSQDEKSQPSDVIVPGKGEEETQSLMAQDLSFSIRHGQEAAVPGIDVSQGTYSSGAVSAAPGKLGLKRKRGRPLKRKRATIGPASKIGRPPHVKPGPVSSKSARRTSTTQNVDPTYVRNTPVVQSEPRTFALRPKTTRSPIEIIAMRQKLEEEAYELEEATREARKLKRKQAHFGKLGISSDLASQQLLGACKPCSVVLVDFVKELHLNSIDTSDQYISDVSFDSDEKDLDDEEDYADEFCPPLDDDFVVEDQKRFGIKMKLSVKDAVKRRLPFSAQAYEAATSSEYAQRATFTTSRKSTSPYASGVKKTVPDLDSLRGKGFMGNFVDFIKNRDSQEMAPQKGRHRVYPKMPVVSGFASSTSVAKSLVSVAPVSASMVSSNVLSTSCTSQSVALAPSSCDVNAAEVHRPAHSQLSSQPYASPFRAAESKHTSGEKIQYSQHLSSTTKHSAEKGQSPGKLKVFPSRRESDGGSEKASTTRYLCSKCDFSATNKGTMESHIYRHIPGVNFKCGYCESEFTGLISALTHVKNSHNSKEPKVWISKDINEASLYTEEEMAYVEPSSQVQQQRSGTSDPATVVSQTGEAPVAQENQPVIISLVVSGDMPVQRSDCFSSSPLVTHRRFACTHCSYSTNVMEDAHQHVRDLHDGGSLFTCCLCDKAFGCSQEDIVAHCEATHPYRPKSFKRLPDFFDQELLRQSSTAGDRAKASESRGNIFDRMSTFFPGMGPGSEIMEDGQLSPQARFLKARDYLYIQEGWSKKTSAEADSTTIEDIEIPFEDSADMDASVLDSTTSEEHSSQHHLEKTDGGNFEVSDKKSCVTTSSSVAETKNTSIVETESSTSSGIHSSKHEDTESTPASSDQHKNLEQQTNKGQEACPSVAVSHNQTSEAKSDSNSCVTTQRSASETAAEALSTSVHSSELSQSGNQAKTETTKLSQKDESVENSAAQYSPDTQSPGDEFSANGEDEQDKVSSRTKESAGEATGPKEQYPVPSETEVDGDDDGETDILVIDLGDEVMDDVADDTSRCSTPEDSRTELLMSETDRDCADAPAVSAEDATGSPSAGMGSDQSAAGLSPRGRQSTSEDYAQNAVVSESNVEDNHRTAGDKEEEEDDMGIKILSVVSLRDKTNHIPEISPFSADSHSASEESSPSISASPASKHSPMKKSSGSASHKSSSARKLFSSSTNLPEVNADDIATRNERMVCTYKCHKCSIHSPALSAIVEHLKQHHNDVPLFSCPYCKSKKDSFFTEEKVHMHVNEHHPSNYAKNEVSLSEVAKSFVQVLALPSGKSSRSSLTEQDIYMCLKCESHVPDLDYGLQHLKSEHPGLLKYACPVCCTFLDSMQDVVKKHLGEVHGCFSDSVQLSVVMEDVYLNKVTSISVNGQYVDHSKAASSTTTSKEYPDRSPCGVPVITPASVESHPMDNAALVASGPVNPLGLMPVPVRQVSPFILAPVQQQTPSFGHHHPRTGKSSRQRARNPFSPKTGIMSQPRLILPMPGSPMTAHSKVDLSLTPFQMTGVTVKNILDTRQKTQGNSAASLTSETDIGSPLSISVSSPSSPSFATNVSASIGQAPPDPSSPRGMFSMTDKLDRVGRARGSVSPHSLSHSHTSLVTTTVSSVASPSRPVLRVPNVSSVLDLTSTARSLSLSVDTGTSVNTLPSGASSAPTPTLLSSRSPGKSLPVSSLPFSIAALTAPVTTVSALDAHASTTAPKSHVDREDPEAFKIFNLKPRTPVPQSPRPAGSPSVSVHKTSPSVLSPASPCITQPANHTPAAVTMASSALFPQQFRLQQFPQTQPANITTLPLGQGGLPLAQNIAMPLGANFPLNQGGLTIPIDPGQTQLFMAQNSITPLVVTANLLSQFGLPGPVPQLPLVAGPASSPVVHQPIPDIQPAPVNLSVSQQGRPSASMTSPPNPRASQSAVSTGSSKTTLQPRTGVHRGRGRPRLNRNPLVQQAQPMNSRPPTPRPATIPRPSVPLHQPFNSPVTQPFSNPVTSSSPVSSQQSEKQPGHKPQRHSGSHYCACPYCPETLKPWEVAQHIKVNHPGKEVKYNRV